MLRATRPDCLGDLGGQIPVGRVGRLAVTGSGNNEFSATDDCWHGPAAQLWLAVHADSHAVAFNNGALVIGRFS
jgi:hypothetical protein